MTKDWCASATGVRPTDTTACTVVTKTHCANLIIDGALRAGKQNPSLHLFDPDLTPKDPPCVMVKDVPL